MPVAQTPGGAGSERVAGCDLGKATATFVVADIGGGSLEFESVETVVHSGQPMDAFCEWYRNNDISSCLAIGATGLHADELAAPVLRGLPEDACLQAALDGHTEISGPVNIVNIGARGYSVLTRDADGHFQYLENDKCSSGTGETMVKIAGRFGLSIGEADALASESEELIPITARCSVFAKSEMTHFGNQGRPAAALFRGYFRSVAVYVAALLARARVDGPVFAIGGAASIRTLVTELTEAVGSPVSVPEHHRALEAIGATVLAAGQARAQDLHRLPEVPEALIERSEARFETLVSPRAWAERVTRLESPPVPDNAAAAPCVLGLDLGSTGSKAVLTSIETGDAYLDVYDRTRGNPVDAAQRLLRAIGSEVDPDVRAVALTGSGREAAATVMRAAFPELADRVVVVNEIVAHATAAIRCDEEGGDSLSVVEIGGQDAKFIQIRGGHIVESDMNKACSAGTGSFLEEQAVFYGIDDIEEFTALAEQAERPPDLGQMCTVFVAEAAAQAHNEGFGLADLFGGFQYSVIHNYMNRVMGQRTFGRRIFFQGKPASGTSLAWTLAAVADREVVVPPNPGAMGAWGVGLHALEELGPDALTEADRFDLRRVLRAEVVERSEFQCRDKQCATLCSIERTKVAVGGETQAVLSGGACPKYEVSRASRDKLPMNAPSPFDERAALLAPYLEPRHAMGGQKDGEEDTTRVGLPVVGALYGYVPWLVTFLERLGLEVEVLRSESDSLARGEARCYSFDACAPAKTAHGVVDAGVGTVFFPKLTTLGDRDGAGGRTCPIEQGLPEMVREALHARGRPVNIVHPVLSLEDGLWNSDLLVELVGVAESLGAPRRGLREVASATLAAARAQERYEEELADIGVRALAYGREHSTPIVVVCGPLHVIHDPVVGAGIPRLLRENGVLAIPLDCFTIPAGTHGIPNVPWAEANRVLRTAVAAREAGDIYPLLLSSFGCGPASFTEQFFTAILEDFPHTALESDGHGGTAGYTTRVQAFLHTVRRHDGSRSPVAAERLRLLEPPPNESIKDDPSKVVIFSLADHASPLIAAGYRAHGLDAVASGPANADALRLGRRDCSGKECLPYQLIWGSFRQHLEDNGFEPQVLVQVTGEGMCRNCMFTTKDRLSLERLGREANVRVRDFQTERDFGWSFTPRIALGLVAWDVLYQLASYHRPHESFPGEVDAAYRQACGELESLIERPAGNGLGQAVAVGRAVRDVNTLLDKAAGTFAEIERNAPDSAELRTVLLSGDIYVRVDEFASDHLVRRLNERGMRVIVEPTQVLIEYLAHVGARELVRLPKGGRRGPNLVANGMTRLRGLLYSRVRRHHAWLPAPDIDALLVESEQVLDRYPQGEAPVTVGSVLHHWNSGLCDGVVVVSPWGCGPALIAESLLRHRHEIPMLFVYVDGSPIDERRLNAFAFRLRRQPVRAPAGTATPCP